MANPVAEPANGIFLSYSSLDREAALKLKGGLERLGIAVRLDLEAVRPGQALQSFILESIRSTGATVLVISESSLVSDWVGYEVGTTLTDRELWNQRQFIACYLDTQFLEDQFRIRATEIIDARLAELKQVSLAHLQKNLDTRDLVDKETRLMTLRVQLGPALQHLRNSLCLDLRGDQFGVTLSRLANHLRPLSSGPTQQVLRVASDLEARKNDIYELVANADGDGALKRIMDFVRDFSPDEHKQREIIFAIGEYRKLEKVEGRTLKELRLERREILNQALDLLDEILDLLTLRAA
jgi:hypothetical protein